MLTIVPWHRTKKETAPVEAVSTFVSVLSTKIYLLFSAPIAAGTERMKSRQLKAVKVHHLVPGGYEVTDKLVLVLRIHLSDSPQFGI